MMQIFLAVVLLAGKHPPTWKMSLWVLFSISLGGVSLAIAGARSRLVIVAITFVAAAIVLLLRAARGKSAQAANATLQVFLIVCVVAAAVVTSEEQIGTSPILIMMRQTIDHGDINDRLGQSIESSQLPGNITFLGQGLGSTASGRPGEFGVRAMWIESGLFWTPLMLLLYGAIALLLGLAGLRAARSGNTLMLVLTLGPLLAWLFAVLAGLSSSFELSQSLLLIPTIAALSITPLQQSIPAVGPQPLSGKPLWSARVPPRTGTRARLRTL